MADYNIAMDKQRQGSDVSELHGYIREYDAKNKAFAKEIDMVFLAKQQEEANNLIFTLSLANLGV